MYILTEYACFSQNLIELLEIQMENFMLIKCIENASNKDLLYQWDLKGSEQF